MPERTPPPEGGPPPDPGGTGGPQEPLEPLEALRISLEETQRATERLVRETADFAAAESAGTGPMTGAGPAAGEPPPDAPRTPPRGWASAAPADDASKEIAALARLLETLRGVLPEDIQRQVTEILRQLLLLLRAIIDWWISRIERGGRGREVHVEDIPIV